MKKIFYLFGASLLFLTSCSSDDNSSDSVASILPKTMKNSSLSSGYDTVTFVYDGNKIVSIKQGITRTDYTYDGNVIVKSTTYAIASGKEGKSSEESFTYANKKLANYYYAYTITAQFPLGQARGGSVYTYNSDGTVTSESYYINPTTGEEVKTNYAYVQTFVNGNMVKSVGYGTTPGSNNVSTSVFEYDSKNNPFKNITGFKLLLNSGLFSSANNVVKAILPFVNNNTSGVDTYKNEYVYDANGYPTKITIYAKDGATVDRILEYTY